MRNIKNLSLLTDLYELTMMQGYFFKNPEKEAVFDVFFRKNPFDGGFVIFAGLEPLVEEIINIKFSEKDLEYLESLGIFKKEFLDYLSKFKFSGNLYSVKEGTVVFPDEPLIRIEGKLVELQLIESMVLNFINFQSLIATKTSRVVLAARGGAILEFGLRRAQGIDGAISAARASFIGGAAGTSNVLAGKIFDIPVKGTMAHSWVMSFENELEAFKKYAEFYPDNCILLVDTFDTLKSGIPNAIEVFKDLKKKGIKNFGIRLDSGDLEYLSKEARKMFDKEGLKEAKIIASNELDEFIINQLIENNAPIDAWGVGTKLVTGDKTPALSGVYKIVAIKDGDKFKPCIKISNNPEKISNPGIKNIYRFYDENKNMLADLIFLEEEKEEIYKKIENKEPIKFNHPNISYAHFVLENYSYAKILLEPAILKGERILRKRHLKEIQEFAKKELNSLDKTYKRLINPHKYKVSLSEKLKNLKFSLIEKYRKN